MLGPAVALRGGSLNVAGGWSGGPGVCGRAVSHGIQDCDMCWSEGAGGVSRSVRAGG